MFITTFYCQKPFLTLIYHPYPPLYLSNTYTTSSHPQATIPTSSPTILLKIPKNNSPIICTLAYPISYLYFISIFLLSSSLSHSHKLKHHCYPLFHYTSLALQFTSNIPKFPRQLQYDHLLLLLCGDIKSNLGPFRTLLTHHLPDHKRRNRIYFNSQTIQLRPEYQLLHTSFVPHLLNTHPKHPEVQHTHPFSARFLRNNTHHPPPRLLYTLIVTISPHLERCNLLLVQPSPIIRNLLTNMATLNPPPEQT
jgi:hypothetical protein